jgi:hypothetical protein
MPNNLFNHGWTQMNTDAGRRKPETGIFTTKDTKDTKQVSYLRKSKRKTMRKNGQD